MTQKDGRPGFECSVAHPFSPCKSSLVIKSNKQRGGKLLGRTVGQAPSKKSSSRAESEGETPRHRTATRTSKVCYLWQSYKHRACEQGPMKSFSNEH